MSGNAARSARVAPPAALIRASCSRTNAWMDMGTSPGACNGLHALTVTYWWGDARPCRACTVCPSGTPGRPLEPGDGERDERRAIEQEDVGIADPALAAVPGGQEVAGDPLEAIRGEGGAHGFAGI